MSSESVKEEEKKEEKIQAEDNQMEEEKEVEEKEKDAGQNSESELSSEEKETKKEEKEGGEEQEKEKGEGEEEKEVKEEETKETAETAVAPSLPPELANWVPKTKLGKMVLRGEIKDIDEIFARGLKIREPEIVDYLLPNLKHELVLIGGTPGKGGGIRRTPTRRTARMHRSGRRYKISAFAIVGDENGHVGVGKGEGTTHAIAIEKAIKRAKLNLIPVARGCGSWECRCGEPHSIPARTSGKCGSVRVTLIPAPRGLGLCCGDELKKLLRLAGIKDIWSKSKGNTRTRMNFVLAAFDALKKLNAMRK